MESHYLTVNNIRLHYVTEGTGEVVILLHGFPEFWYSWRNQIPVLSKHFTVIAPDMRGYNLSDKPKGVDDYRIEVLTADIAELIKALNVGKVNMVGHDWGGAVAWNVASKYPELINKLAILNMPCPAEMKKAFFNFNLAQLLKSYYIFFFQLPFLPEWFLGRNISGTWRKTLDNMSAKPGTYTDEDIAQYVKAFSQPGALNATINYYRAAMRNIGSSVEEILLSMPVLLLWGEKDKALGKELTLNTSHYCKQLQVIYDPGSGHFIQHDNPELVNKSLLDFFLSK